MKYLHTHARRLTIAVLLVGAVGLAPALTLSARSANLHGPGSNGYIVSFYKQDVLLGSIPVADGSGLDVVWKDTVCSNHYSSPPVAFTWSGTSTGATSAPSMGPCGTAPGSSSRPKGPDDIECVFSSTGPFIDCYWTWKATSGSSTTSAKIVNPGGTTGNVYLFRRTALYAYLVTPNQPYKKTAVPPGADTITFAPAS